MFDTSARDGNEPVTLKELVVMSAEKYADKPFFRYVQNGEVTEKSYMQVYEDSFAMMRYIRSLSEKRHHIALIGTSCYGYIVSLTGIMLSGNVVVPASPDASPAETAEILVNSDTDTLFYDASYAGKAQELLKLCPSVTKAVNLGDVQNLNNIFSDYSGASVYAALSDFEPDPDKCVLIMYTSGTTGIRKGTMLSTRALISNMNFREFSFTSDDVTLSVLPMHHIFAFSCDFLKNFKDGVTVCLNGDMSMLPENLLRFEPTMIRLVPMIIETLLRRIRAVQKRKPELSPAEAAKTVLGSRLHFIIASGAYLNPELAEEFEEFGITLRAAYGMTEAGPRISVPDGTTSAQSVGRIISICDARINGGEIQVKSESLMMGYYKMPEETAAMFTPDGYLRTGDIGRIAEDRQLYITGRLKNLIILSNGENISPEEVEKRFSGEKLIKEVMVYEENDRLTAEFFPDYEYAELHGIADIAAELTAITERANSGVPSVRAVSKIRVRPEPFDRTSSGKVIRKTVSYA